MAGAIGGFNAHAANIVTALFIATGQVGHWASCGAKIDGVKDKQFPNQFYLNCGFHIIWTDI